MSYIPPEYHRNLKQFKYTGGTDSISYKYLWSPFAQHVLKFFPIWMAPNVITLSALVVLIITHIIFMLPDVHEIPQWKFFLMAISIIIYQHLDNIDGKQARRTNSSSPLGMLFDHGSDAITGFLIGGQTIKMFKVMGTSGILAIYMFVMSIFFTAMWMQYSIGFFRLGRINPVDEGLPAYALLAFVMAFIDRTNFENYHIFGTYGQQFIISLTPLLTVQLFQMGKYIFKKAVRPKNEVISVLWLFLSTGLALIGLYLFDNQIYNKQFIPIYYLIMFFWARNMILIQLYFITKQKYKVFNRGTNFFLFSFVFYIMINCVTSIQPSIYFFICCIIQGIIFMEFIVSLFREGAQILNIHVFSIPTKKQ